MSTLSSSPLRKRTSSFSFPCPAFSPNPRPSKAPRTDTQMGTLRRSETCLSLPPTPSQELPYYRTLQYQKDQRLRRKLANRSQPDSLTIRITTDSQRSAARHAHTPQQQQAQPPPQQRQPLPQPRPSRSRTPSHFFSAPPTKRFTPTAPSQVILPSIASPITIVKTHRTSSPLSPVRNVLPGRPVFPRSKPEPDLYRKAIYTRMRCTPEGQKILHMGPRLALSIITATRELERIVADQQFREREADAADITMSDSTFMTKSTGALPVLTSSWVVVKGEDWEMVDCAA